MNEYLKLEVRQNSEFLKNFCSFSDMKKTGNRYFILGLYFVPRFSLKKKTSLRYQNIFLNFQKYKNEKFVWEGT